MARRKLVSGTRACCACMRRRVWRQLAISIQAVIALSAHDQPEQAAADHAQRGAVGLGAQDQAVADRRDRHLVFVGVGWPRAASRWPVWRSGIELPASTLPVPSSSATAYLADDLGRHAVAQQAVDRVFAQDHAGEAPLLRQGDVQLQQRRCCRRAGRWLRVDRLPQVARQAERRFRFRRGLSSRRPCAPDFRLARLGVTWLAMMRRRSSIQVSACSSGYWLTSDSARRHEFLGVHFLVGDVARQAHQLFLAFQQAQAQALLGVFHVALDGLLLAVDLLQAQVAEGGHDGGQEQQHGHQRRQHGEAVLARGVDWRRHHRRHHARGAVAGGKPCGVGVGWHMSRSVGACVRRANAAGPAESLFCIIKFII